MVRKFKPEYVITEPPEINFIVVSQNEISMLEFQQSKKTWEKYASNFPVRLQEAVTPDTLNDADKKTPINFFRKAPNKEWQCWREFTEIEKSIWYSHASLWKRCIDVNKPIIVVEQDCALMVKLNWKIFANWEMMCLADYKGIKWAANCYYITPTAAKFLLHYIRDPVDHNVDSWIDKVCCNIGEFRFYAKHFGTAARENQTHTPHTIDEMFRNIIL